MSFVPPTYRGAPNAGVDLISVTLLNNTTNASVAFGGRRSGFVSSNKDELITGTGMDNGGRIDHRFIRSGVQGSIMVERYNGDLIAVKKFIDANFYAGNPEDLYTITKTVVNPGYDKSKDTDVFTYCVLSIAEGEFRRAGAITATITFHAQEQL